MAWMETGRGWEVGIETEKEGRIQKVKKTRKRGKINCPEDGESYVFLLQISFSCFSSVLQF